MARAARFTLVLNFAAACFAVTPETARAAGAEDVALAERLFQEAKQQMARGDVAGACPRLQESMRLDPAGGTQLALALCYESAGRLASAWGAFHAALGLAERDRRTDRTQIAQAHIAALRPRLATLRIDLVEAARAPGLRVFRDGVEIGHAAWGVALPLDAGTYQIRAEAPGRVPWEESVSINAEGAHAVLTVPELRELPPARVAMSDAASPRRAERVNVAAPAMDEPAPAVSQRSLAYIFGGVGVAGLVTGGIFGVRALALRSELGDLCPRDPCDPASQVNYRETRRDWTRAATAANLGVGLGVLSAAAGAYFWWTSDPATTASATGVGLASREDGAVMTWSGEF